MVFRNIIRSSVPIWLVLVGGAVAMVASGAVSVPEAYSAIDLPVIMFLFSMFVLVTALDLSGALEWFANELLRRSKSPAQLLYLIFGGFAFASAILMNDTIALVGTTVMVSMARKLKVSSKPFLLALAFAVTIGSVPTPMGNPQNMLVALSSGMATPVLSFARYLLLPTLANVAVTMVLLRRIFRKELSVPPERFNLAKAGLPPNILKDPGLAHVAVGTTILASGLIVAVNALQAAGISEPFGIAEVSLFAAVLLLILSGNARSIIAALDWGILLLFAGLFVLIQGLSVNGVISLMANLLPPLGSASPASSLPPILASGVVLSQLLSNVPMVAVYIPVLSSLGFTGASAYAWTALAAGATIAGNLTILGAASNLIIIEQAERQGEALTFYEFLKVGVPVTLANVAVLYLFLVFGL